MNYLSFTKAYSLFGRSREQIENIFLSFSIINTMANKWKKLFQKVYYAIKWLDSEVTVHVIFLWIWELRTVVVDRKKT